MPHIFENIELIFENLSDNIINCTAIVECRLKVTVLTYTK